MGLGYHWIGNVTSSYFLGFFAYKKTWDNLKRHPVILVRWSRGTKFLRAWSLQQQRTSSSCRWLSRADWLFGCVSKVTAEWLAEWVSECGASCLCVPAQLLHYVILYSQSRRRVAPQRQKWQFSYTAAQLHSSPHCTDCPVLSRRILQRTNFIRLVETKKNPSLSLHSPLLVPASGGEVVNPILLSHLTVCARGEKESRSTYTFYNLVICIQKKFWLLASVRQENNVLQRSRYI